MQTPRRAERVKVLDLDHLDLDQNLRFNEVAQSVRHEFNALVEDLSRDQTYSIDWMVGSLASRNKYQSPLFIRCCMLAFVQAELSSGRPCDRVATSDRVLAAVLTESSRRWSPGVAVICTESLRDRVWRVLRPFRQFALATAALTLRYMARRAPRLRDQSPDRAILLVDTFILNNAPGDQGSLVGGVWKDRYFPGMLDVLTDEVKRDVYYLPTVEGFLNPISAYRRVRALGSRFILHDDYLRLSDYVFALGHPFRIRARRLPRASFRGVDIGALLRQERFRNCCDFIGLIGLLYYRFAQRLAECGVCVRLLLDWHENQVLDRGLIAGIHRFHPGSLVIGYQGYVVSAGLHLYTHPNRTEKQSGCVPDSVAVIGESLIADMREFCPELAVEVAPAFRFVGLWRERRFQPDEAAYTVLVALPIDLADSAQILNLVVAARERLKGDLVRFVVKPHPTSRPDQIKKLVAGGWPDEWLSLVIGDFHEHLEQANLLISNASSTSLEALAKGVPAIVVAPASGIIQNPIPGTIDRRLWALCHDSTELLDAILSFRDRSCALLLPELTELSRQIRRNYFAPVTREGVQTLLRLK